jgi:ankyrin repeat protein
MSPLLLILDGVLSQDEDRVAQALQEIAIARVLPIPILNGSSPSDLMGTTGPPTTATSNASSSDALLNFLRALLEATPSLAGIASSHDGSLPLHFAASLGDVRVASLLLDYVRVFNLFIWRLILR